MSRRRYEFNKGPDVIWAVLADSVPPVIVDALDASGIEVCEPEIPETINQNRPIYSPDDPYNSILGALLALDHLDSQRANLLRLLIERNGEWLTKEHLRWKTSSAQADRRWRELRQDKWPLETRPIGSGEWLVRLNLDPDDLDKARRLYSDAV